MTEKMRSMYSKMSTNIASSVFGASRPSGWTHGWMMPFISR